MPEIMLYYLLGINFAAFVLYGIDKQKARMGRWRIPESVLILMAVLGGGAGAYAGMLLFHHKTRKPLFSIGVPIITIIELCVLAAYVLKLT